MTSRPEFLIERMHQEGVPVFASDAGTVERFHALATESVSFEQLGAHVGQIGAEILGGRDIRTVPISTVEETCIFVSLDAEKTLGLSVREKLADANVVYFGSNASDPEKKDRGGQMGWIGWATVTILVVLGVASILRRSRRSNAT